MDHITLQSHRLHLGAKFAQHLDNIRVTSAQAFVKFNRGELWPEYRTQLCNNKHFHSLIGERKSKHQRLVRIQTGANCQAIYRAESLRRRFFVLCMEKMIYYLNDNGIMPGNSPIHNKNCGLVSELNFIIIF